MRTPIVPMMLMCLGVFAQALAMEPPSSTPAPQGTSESAAPAQADRTPAASQSDAKPAVAAATASSATAAASAAPNGSRISLTTTDPVAEAQLKRLRAAGYKPELHNGEILFCRQETVVGSRFDQKICNTSDQLENVANTAREQAAKAQRNIGSKLVPN